MEACHTMNPEKCTGNIVKINNTFLQLYSSELWGQFVFYFSFMQLEAFGLQVAGMLLVARTREKCFWSPQPGSREGGTPAK